jgi:hypothetical protein
MPFPTLGIWRRKKPQEIDHQYQFVDGFEGSIREFYDAIESDLAARKVPGMQISREHFAEGGLFSATREYLRMRRERLVFDVCSAPFGRGWFYSYRFAEIPVTLMVWELLLALAVVGGLVQCYLALFGFLWGGIIVAATLYGIGWLLRNSVKLGYYGLDDFLIRLPVFGAVYEALFRPETYHRIDTRLMYVTLVRQIIEARVSEALAAQGFKQSQFQNASPDLHQKLAELLKHTPKVCA